MNPPSLLIVEDDPLLLETLTTFFASKGYAVRVAGDGEEALAQIRAAEPDLVLLDIVMPRCDGIQFLRTLRTSAPGLPVIVMTNLEKEETRRECLELGAKEYVSKSAVSLADLEARVAKQGGNRNRMPSGDSGGRRRDDVARP